MAPVVVAADLSSTSSRSALLCSPSAPASMGDDGGGRERVEESGDRGRIRPRLSIGPSAGHHAASAVILFQRSSGRGGDGAFLDAKTSLPRSSAIERRESTSPALRRNREDAPWHRRRRSLFGRPRERRERMQTPWAARGNSPRSMRERARSASITLSSAGRL